MQLDLPVHLTPFVGRDHELQDLAELLPSARLLTLTGAGGSGKTRLARELTFRVAPEFERVGWVDLAAIHDAELIPQLIAASLQLPERTDVTPRERIEAAICDLRTLLVLDNCEHVVDACAAMVESLLRECPRICILATSREALSVSSEISWLVPPLVSLEAVQLFVDRAQATQPGFTLNESNSGAILEIARRLDGMPLAIELAAARVRVLTPNQIAQRLDDAFRLLTSSSRTALPRHRTLRATMEWSYGLLATREQVLLNRLSVFAGSFSLEAAEAVCTGEPLESEDILDGVTALVDKSLITMMPGDGVARYRMLETVRQYGLERLREAGELDRLEELHAHFFLELIEASDSKLYGGEKEPGLLKRLGQDNDNLRAAAAWAVRDDSRSSLALRFAVALFWYWYGSTMNFGPGQFREGRRFINDALAAAQRGNCDPGLRGKALISRGLIGLAQGDNASASADFDQAIALLRQHAHPKWVTFALTKGGANRLMMGDLDAAWAMLEEAYKFDAERPYEILHSFVYSWRGAIALARGDTATAREMHEGNLRVGVTLKHRTVLGHGHAFLGAVELRERHVNEAFAHFCEALPYHVDLGDGWGLALDIEGLAACAALRGRHADAARLLGAGDAIRERSAVALPASDAADRERRVKLAREKTRGEFERLYAEGRALTLDEIVRLATDESVVQTSEFRVPVAIACDPDEKDSPRLRVQTLGPLQVVVGDTPIDASAWGSARPRELLVYLLMHPEGRTKEQVGLAFWPDASAAQMRNNFHVTLHRLRKTLGGPNWVLLEGDRYRVPQSLVAELDVTLFEREVTDAKKALRKATDASVLTATMERALTRYRGDFLDGEPAADWHLEHRDRLQRLYVDALMELGGRYVEEERYAKAADAFRRVLTRDELHEEALRALMKALTETGERSQALRAYQRFASRLRDELEAEPDAETLALAGSIKG